MKNTKKLTVLAILSALIIIMTFVPFIGYISVGIFSITTIPLVVIIGAIIIGKEGAIVLSLVFGIFSLIRATMPGSIADPLFINPLISVLPRLLFGLFAYYIYKYFNKKDYKFKYELTFAAATLFHTLIVCLMFGIVKPTWFFDIQGAVSSTYPFINNIFMVIIFAFLINGILETIINTLIGPQIVKRVKLIRK